ncbi:MAG: hypothetical protein JNK05_07655 [Myxococcales bacterium]|nr:hypothetical protein [Myxococcales bacterium]
MALQAAASQPPSQAAIAARQAEIRGQANALLARAQREPSPQPRTIPPPRTSNFQEFVNRQHDRAFREGGAETVTTVAGLAIGARMHASSNHGVHAAAAPIGTTVGELPHIVHNVAHPDAESIIATAGTAATHILAEAATELPGGAAVAGAASLVRNAGRIFEDGDARRDFQQNASEYDRRRANTQRIANVARDFGEVDAKFATVGRSEVNWELYRTDGDYAAGVNRGLREAARNPGGVAHLALNRFVPPHTAADIR